MESTNTRKELNLPEGEIKNTFAYEEPDVIIPQRTRRNGGYRLEFTIGKRQFKISPGNHFEGETVFYIEIPGTSDRKLTLDEFNTLVGAHYYDQIEITSGVECSRIGYYEPNEDSGINITRIAFIKSTHTMVMYYLYEYETYDFSSTAETLDLYEIKKLFSTPI